MAAKEERLSEKALQERATAAGIDLEWFKVLWKQFAPVALDLLITVLVNIRNQSQLAAGVRGGGCCDNAKQLACALRCLNHAGEEVADHLLHHLDGCCDKPA